MFNRISYPRRGVALILYVLALALLGTAIVAALTLRTALLIGAALALMAVSDVLTLRKTDDEVQPAPLVTASNSLTRIELEAFGERLRAAMSAALPDDYVNVELSFECTSGARAAEIVADLNAGHLVPLQEQGYTVDRATWHGAELDWQGLS